MPNFAMNSAVWNLKWKLDLIGQIFSVRDLVVNLEYESVDLCNGVSFWISVDSTLSNVET